MGISWHDVRVVPQPAKRRWIAYLAIAIVGCALAATFTILNGRKTSERSDETQALDSLVDRVAPGICQMQLRLNTNDRAGAFNVYYDEVHQGVHVLASRLVKANSKETATFSKMHALVERDLRMLSPTLKQSVAAFADELHVAMESDRVGSWKPC